MMKLLISLVLLAAWHMPGASASDYVPYEMLGTHTVQIKHTAADRQYDLYVKLPEDYDASGSVLHPVIYTTDADWHMPLLAGTADYLMPNAILVGISWQTDMQPIEGLENTPAYASRFRDYTPIPSKNAELQDRYRFGDAANHLEFITRDVIPYIEGTLKADPKARTYLGYSLGGLFGAYSLLSQPETFQNYILGSPALDADDAAYLDALESETAPTLSDLETAVFVTIGDQEQAKMDRVKGLVDVLKRRSPFGQQVSDLVVIEASDHAAAVPDTFSRSLRWLRALER